MATGKVTQVETLSDYGKIVRVDHGALIDGKHTETRYAHLSKQQHDDGSPIKVGEIIERGQDLGIMGETGSLAKRADGKSNVHLHSELWLDGVRVDEQPYQKEASMKPNARQIGTGGAKRREEPTTIGDNFDPSESYAPGVWVEWDGFVRSTMPGGQPSGDNIWLVKDGLYTAWATTVPVAGDGALAGIPDLGTYPKIPVPPVVTPPTTTAGATKAEVEAIVLASERRILAAIANPVTLAEGEHAKIADAVRNEIIAPQS